MAHVSESKKQVVDEFTKLMDEYPVVGVVNMADLPTRTVQEMREKLRKNGTVLRMTKKRLMKVAFAKAKKENVSDLMLHFKGMPALIFTKENPFKLYGLLEKNKSNAPAKAGSEAPKDIVVKAGPTTFSPGPIIGQLGKFGIKSGVEGGKLAIKEDAVVAKKGDIINAELAGILIRLGVEPMEIGLDLTAAYEDGQIYTSDILFIDTDAYMNKFVSAHNEAFNLAVEVVYPVEDVLNVLVPKLAGQARALSLETGFMTTDTSSDILSKAFLEMLSLSNNLSDDAKSDELKSIKSAPVAAAVETPKDDSPKRRT